MSMRERMARAIFDACIGADARAIQPWEQKSMASRYEYYAMADAALDALMKPTDGMSDAVPDHAQLGNVSDVWDAMIRAAREGK